MAAYRFLTTWHIEAPIEAVWEAIRQSERWPEWWRGVRQVVELERGDDNGIGNRRRYTFRSRLPYDLVFEMRTTRVEYPQVLDGAALGELEGEGRWRLEADGNGTVVRYAWEVRTSRRWMNWLVPLARPLFAWNHDLIMRRGEEGLNRYLRDRSGQPGQPLRGGPS